VRGAAAIAALASAFALAEGGCGTDQWVFDAPDKALDGGSDSADIAVLEASILAESGPPPDAGVADTAPLSHADAGTDSRAGPDGGCSSDTDCASAGTHCDTASGECVECVTDGDCGSGLVCESLQCVASCANGAVCPAATPVCRQPTDVCVPCSANSDCARAATGSICLTTTGQCVQCLTDANCQDGFCDTTTNACIRL
jgi:Cys-rich repeat protein